MFFLVITSYMLICCYIFNLDELSLLFIQVSVLVDVYFQHHATIYRRISSGVYLMRNSRISMRKKEETPARYEIFETNANDTAKKSLKHRGTNHLYVTVDEISYVPNIYQSATEHVISQIIKSRRRM